jgi:hypothetical protein
MTMFIPRVFGAYRDPYPWEISEREANTQEDEMKNVKRKLDKEMCDDNAERRRPGGSQPPGPK